jgi:hypothetical protein
VHFGKGKLHQPHWCKEQDLKLLSDICRRQEFGRTEMAASGVVNYHVEMTGLAKGVHERSVNLAVVPEIELDTMKVLELRQTIEVA